MIKCFIVQNVEEAPFGKFDVNRFYIAKVTNNNINTLAIMDNDQNWVPYRWYRTNLEHIRESYVCYFNLWDMFYVNNKKELNEYIPTTKFYK